MAQTIPDKNADTWWVHGIAFIVFYLSIYFFQAYVSNCFAEQQDCYKDYVWNGSSTLRKQL